MMGAAESVAIQRSQRNLTALPMDLLDISERAAADLREDLILLSLVDNTGQPTERFYRWLMDHAYAEVCYAIQEEVYSPGLLDKPQDQVDHKYLCAVLGNGPRSAGMWHPCAPKGYESES